MNNQSCSSLLHNNLNCNISKKEGICTLSNIKDHTLIVYTTLYRYIISKVYVKLTATISIIDENSNTDVNSNMEKLPFIVLPTLNRGRRGV
jgi:hypothetical protein